MENNVDDGDIGALFKTDSSAEDVRTRIIKGQIRWVVLRYNLHNRIDVA
jgi:hypothetical protein